MKRPKKKKKNDRKAGVCLERAAMPFFLSETEVINTDPAKATMGWYRKHEPNMGEREREFHAENLKIYYENMQARNSYSMDGARSLGAAVCLAAIKEFRKNVRNEASYRHNIETYREFFESELFQHFVGDMDTETISRKIMRIPLSYIDKLEVKRT